MRGRGLSWVAVFAGWSALVAVFALSRALTAALTYQPPRWRYAVMMAATDWYVWAAMTPAIVWLSRRFHITRAQPRRALLLAAAGLPVALIKVTATRLLRGTFGGDEYAELTNLVTQYLIFWSIVTVEHAWAYYRRTRQHELRSAQLETRLAQARLQMLSMQLQPHFLFNTLNTIAELVHHSPDTAERMIGSLGGLLRETLQAGGLERVTLDHELQLLDRYVEIQRARFGDRLEITSSVAGPARAALVPGLLLQPLVENAISHGIGTRAAAGRIGIVAARESDRLIIEIIDNGRGLREGAVVEGVGLGNCRARLAALFGADDVQLTIANRPEGGAVVRISMPFQVAA